MVRLSVATEPDLQGLWALPERFQVQAVLDQPLDDHEIFPEFIAPCLPYSVWVTRHPCGLTLLGVHQSPPPPQIGFEGHVSSSQGMTQSRFSLAEINLSVHGPTILYFGPLKGRF